uniref:Uncharacterized protein n=1 Tax=Rhizophora mucronata TaxID=61149 RepID=A0A2P2PCH1_RHIMU
MFTQEALTVIGGAAYINFKMMGFKKMKEIIELVSSKWGVIPDSSIS